MCETAVVTKARTKGGAVAYLMVDGAINAAEFYKKAFGAELAAAQPVDVRLRIERAVFHQPQDERERMGV